MIMSIKCLGVLLISVLVIGCGGGGGTPSPSPTPGPSGSFTLKSEVVELDKTTATVVSVAPTQVVLRSAPASLAVGQVLVHNALDATRFVRRVTALAPSGDITTVTTEAAGVEDVFLDASIQQSADIKAEDLLKLQPAQPGVTFSAPTRALTRGREFGPNAIAINFGEMQLKDDDGTVLAQVGGSMIMEAGVETRFQKSGITVQEFRVAPYANISGTLSARGRVAGTFSREFPISLQLPVPLTPLGPLGINGTLQLFMKLDGHYSAQGDFVVTAGVSAKEGVQYLSGSGWSLVNEFDKNLTLRPPSLRGEIEMGVSLVRPQLGIEINGIGEAHVTADVLRVLGRVSAQSAPVPGFVVEGLGDFNFTVGGSLRLGPITLWKEDRSFNLGSFQIIQPILLKTLTPTDTQIVYTDLAFHNLRAMNGDGTNDRILRTSTSQLFAPTVSNSTGQIAFGVINATGRGELWVMSGDGSSARRITDGTLSINHPTWRPDGTELAFDAGDSSSIKHVYTVNLSSGAIRKLTSGNENARIPSWSADGAWIYFEQTITARKYIARTASDRETFETILANDTVDYAEPSLSPNGLQLVCRRGGSEILVADEKGRGVRVLLSDAKLSRPTFSPDGLSVLVQRNEINTIGVEAYSLAGGMGAALGTGQQPGWGLRL